MDAKGSVRAIAVWSAKRIGSLPDVPTVMESRRPGFRSEFVDRPARAGEDVGLQIKTTLPRYGDIVKSANIKMD